LNNMINSKLKTLPSPLINKAICLNMLNPKHEIPALPAV